MSARSGPSRRSLRGRRQVGDRGAVFVEFALIIPLLTLFAMGLVEYGIGWKWANDVNAAARDAARTASSEPAYLTADRSALIAIGTLLTGEQLENLEQVIIYRAANEGDTTPSSTCRSITNDTGNAATPGSPRGQSGCNVYGKGQIEYVLANPTDDGPWINSSGNGCNSGDLDRFWCPANRNRSLVFDNLDYLGVYVKVNKPSTTGAGFGDASIERSTVFRLEPNFGGYG